MTPTYADTLLKINGVSKWYGDNIILRNVTAEIKDVYCDGVDRGQVIGLISPSGVGKALANGTLVITPTGTCPIESLTVGDLVSGTDGLSHKVTGVFPQGKKELFKVTFIDRTSVECCDDHLWTTRTKQEYDNIRDKRIYKVVDGKRSYHTEPTGKVAPFKTRSLSEIRKNLKPWDHEIPMPQPVEFISDGKLTLNPYLLGLLLGDGSFRNSCITFSKPEKDLQLAIINNLPVGDSTSQITENEIRIIGDTGKGGAPSYTRQELIKLGLDGKSSIEKFIPKEYLFSSYKNRLHLLRGLLDTDGHVCLSGAIVEFSSSSKQLCEDTQFLARSLGAYVTEGKPRTPTYSYRGEKRKGKTSYRIHISFYNDVVPISSQKNLAKWTGKWDRKIKRTIESIEPTRTADATCISVDSPDSCYLVDQFIVTHNTTLLRLIAGLEQPSNGEITARNGTGMVYVNPGLMGFVTQNYIMFDHRTVESNLLLAASMNPKIKPEDRDTEVLQALSTYRLEDKGKLYPSQLSGGQKQRVAIARQILAGSKFLLLDEPFSGLDPIAEERVCKTLTDIAAHDGLHTTIIVTHHLEAAAGVADTLWMIGRDYEEDKPVPGAYIKFVYNLAEMGLAWRENILEQQDFHDFMRIVYEKFHVL